MGRLQNNPSIQWVHPHYFSSIDKTQIWVFVPWEESYTTFHPSTRAEKRVFVSIQKRVTWLFIRWQECRYECLSIEKRVSRFFIHQQERRYECLTIEKRVTQLFIHQQKSADMSVCPWRRELHGFSSINKSTDMSVFRWRRELHDFPSIDKSVFFAIALKPLDRFHLVTNSLVIETTFDAPVPQLFWVKVRKVTIILAPSSVPPSPPPFLCDGRTFVGLALEGKDIVFRFIVEYSSLRDFAP